SRSTSGTTCGTSPWSAVTRSSSTSPPPTRCGSDPMPPLPLGFLGSRLCDELLGFGPLLG
uniref:Uncharacterized protein n=1 Tax=Aegilops tauschii subsp. strangulata TaxID=200361 RepID=A0A452ZD12_AEGTS